MYSVSWQTKKLGSGRGNIISLRKEEEKLCPYWLSEALRLGGKNVCVIFFSLSDFEILNNNLKH